MNQTNMKEIHMTDEDSIEVSIGTLLTISTGAMLAESFADFHAAADVLMGQPLMTHHFASQAIADQIKCEAIRQHPWLDGIHFPAYECENCTDRAEFCRTWVAGLAVVHGATHTLVSPPETRHVPLFEGLPAKFGGRE